jgi:hypothetical protein
MGQKRAVAAHRININRIKRFQIVGRLSSNKPMPLN